MNKPSSNWLENLILVMQECHAENDTSFVSFIQDLTWGEGDEKYDDYKMVQKLKSLKEKNFNQFPFNVGIDLADPRGSYSVITPAELVDDEKSLNEA